ncbi:hypothetical protein N0V93_003993 [Gnomoniopsis smithogilvyi]|uniref:Fungal lipase-type domain-containing protein n=1 Tax=Gnomoniopsis smithogilvyi TaxID=1191159 RepID=A0A9W8Z0A6_9PEZI|nr:hypothetical protein N0V93_003993 [Gnomoniopsis smithogilvyi]
MFGSRILTIVPLFAVSVISERIPVDSALTDTLTRYAWFASAAYSSNCNIPPFNTTIEKKFHHVITDTQATLFRDDLHAEYILAFRGTSSPWDIITDLRRSLVDCTSALPSCTNCTCHKGFLGQYLAVKEEIEPYLTFILQDTAYSLTATGHSMGASGASILATALKSQGLSLNAYSYGQPRTGNTAYAAYVDSMFPLTSESQETDKLLRVTHANDGIPQVPSQKRGYRHHSTEIWIPPTGDEVYRCIGQEPADCNALLPGYPLNSPHFSYLGVSIGNPLDRNAACKGPNLSVDWEGIISEDSSWEDADR